MDPGQGAIDVQMVKRPLPANFPIGNSMVNAVDDILACIEEKRQPLSSGIDGRRAFEMIVAIHQSHQQGRAPLSFPLVAGDLVVESN